MASEAMTTHGSAAQPTPQQLQRRVLVLYVGGTIGMKKNSNGALEPCAGYLTDEMRRMRELTSSAVIASFDIVEYDELLDSSDMNASDYLRIAHDIRRHYTRYDGFLVAHGTDTMHYTASALSFLLHNIAKPVIITGAMVPLAEPVNDARRNIVLGMMLASCAQIAEVCIFFNDSLFRGNRCDKIRHTYNAFHSPCYPVLGEMVNTSFVVHDEYLLPQPSGRLTILSDLSGRVVCFHLHPGADVDLLVQMLHAPSSSSSSSDSTTTTDAASTTNATTTTDVATTMTTNAATRRTRSGLLDGVLLLLDGVGGVDDVQATLLRRVSAAAAVHDVVVCALAFERVGTLNDAEVRRLCDMHVNVVYLRDMCAAAAEVKLMYLFGRGLDSAQVRAYMPRNLRGEITPPPPLARL